MSESGTNEPGGDRSGNRPPGLRMRPLEIVGLSAIGALFVGIVVFTTARDYLTPGGPILTLVATGATFVVALVVFAMISLAQSPRDPGGPEDDER